MKAKIRNSRTGSSKVFTVSDLSGGLNKKASDYDIADNEAIGLINFIFTEKGILTVRQGYARYNKLEISGASGIYGLFRFYKKDGTTKYFIACTGSDIYSGSSGTWTALTCNETLTADKRFRFAVFKDKLFMTNGTNKPLVWSGTGNVRQIGIVAPSAGSSGNPTSGGNCTDGAHQIRITYYNSTDGIESTHYTLTTQTCSGGNNTIPLSSLAASSDAQVDKIRIYMTEAGGSTFYYVAEQSDGTATYNISISDASLAANASYDATDYLPPPTDCDYIGVSHRRLCLACNSTYPSRFYYSEVDTPEYFPSTNYRDISPDDGDWITGIIAWNDYWYIFKQNGTYVLTDPSDPANSPLREISKDIGIIAPDTLCTGQFQRPVSINDWILVPGIIGYTRFGVQGFDGQTWHMLSERVEPILEKLYEVNKQYMSGFFNKSKYYLAYQPEKGSAVDGGFVTFTQHTTDTGSENKDATYSTDHDVNNYSSTYDARINLSNTSSADKELKVNVFINWSTYTVNDIEYCYSNPVRYEIFFSYDSGTSWTSKGVFEQRPASYQGTSYCNESLKKDRCNFYFSHTLLDSSVTNIRLDYFYYAWDSIPYTDYIRLISVEYFYEYSAAVTGSDVKNNKMLYYDSLHNAWSELWGISANCFCAFNGQLDEGEEYFGSSKNGYIYRMNLGSNDDGEEIFALYHSKHYDCNERILKKRFQQFTLNSDIYSNKLNIEIFSDKVQRSYHIMELSPEGIDTVYWNEKYFGEVIFDRIVNLVQKTLRLTSGCLGRFFCVKIWKSSKESLTIKDWGVKYAEREGLR